ncbi:hypothetical protein B7P43_G17333 [Cryptotermes secundus]|uniref:DUF7041 domain-containing protein n=1 Tax=Cryptotermes secundus TaxID=105785 RepID=A0A2J7PNS7_9NEOP|nr:hypothetical protein B7P43_G17333 [Cryptotermes secundus]
MEEKQNDAGITSRPVPTETPTIAVRLPPLWADRPAVWFAQAEAQFTLAGIGSEQTKFCYVISQLDQRYVSEVENIITSPPERGPYTLLRTELVRRLSPSPEERIRQLLTVEEIGDRKLSQFLIYLKSLAPEVSDNVIRSVWTNRLPRNVQSFLAGQNESNLEAAALCADRVSKVEVRPAFASVKRGALNFIGQVNKILFGTLDADDADYCNEWINQFQTNIYVKDGIIGYVICLPLINKGVFKTFRLIPLQVAMGQGKFIYIETESKLLYADQTRQYYFISDREELRRCKTIEPTKYICKQARPLLNSHMHEACAIKNPRICDIRIVQLTHTIWTQLQQRN